MTSESRAVEVKGSDSMLRSSNDVNDEKDEIVAGKSSKFVFPTPFSMSFLSDDPENC